MNVPNGDSTLLTLLDALCSDALTGEQHVRLQELLRDDAVAQETYFAYLDLHLGLSHVSAVASAGDASTLRVSQSNQAVRLSERRRSSLRLVRVLTTTAIILIGVVAFTYLMTRDRISHARNVATFSDVSGTVQVHGVNGSTRIASAGMMLTAGETVETIKPGSIAVIVHDDTTRLALINDASMTYVADTRKNILLHRGIISARVAPQPTNRAMQLTTPGAKVEVLGTEFAIAASSEQTEVKVSAGRVRLTQVADGQTVELAKGQGAVTGSNSSLTVHEARGPTGEWEIDFESGVPTGWTGTPITTSLPSGSSGAIRTLREPGSEPAIYLISSRDAWVDGYFAIHENSHLHITLKMDQPDWLNLFLTARGNDPTNPTWAMHNFNEVPFWPPKPGKWTTMTIPLSRFRTKHDGVFYNEPPAIGDVVYSLSISSTEPDRGLVIDRMWVTQDGPGEVAREMIESNDSN